MASSYSTDLKLELMATGENAGTWGINTNNNLNLIQQAIAGYEAVALSDGGTVALAMTDKALSNARNMVLKFTGTLTSASTVTIPDSIEKFYIFDLSAVTGVTNLTIKTVSGTGFTAGEAAIVAAYSDGTNLNEIALNTLGGTIATAQIADNAITSAKISANQVTTAKIADNAITTAKISALQVTADKIAQSTITAAKLATDSVGPDQLISTGVTAAEYTLATVTVDADGRVTAASSGTVSAANMQPTFAKENSTNYTADADANAIVVYMSGGGGGAGGPWGFGPNGGPGGHGGLGYKYISITQPYTQPFTLGNGGSGGITNTNGQPGNASTFGSPTIFTANGGNAGQTSANNPGPPGNIGTSPGATFNLGPSQLNTTGNRPATWGLLTNGRGGANPAQAGTTGWVMVWENLGKE